MESTYEEPVELDLLTAGERLGLSRVTVNLLVLRGELPARRRGRQWFVRLEDVDAYAAARGPSALGALGWAGTALAEVAERPGITVEELAGLLGRPRRTVLGWLQLLDRRGLIERRRRNESKAPAQCFLTDAGAELYRQEETTIAALR